MNAETGDRWAQWVLARGQGVDAEAKRRKLEALQRWKQRVLENAAIQTGEVVLDVGTGDGLIGFGALDLVAPTGRVVFSDISPDLVVQCRSIADALGVQDQCDFVVASAAELGAIADGTLDVVTMRSVLIYLPFEQKHVAFRHFHRVLGSGGRLSIFEPINSRFPVLNEDEFWGYDTRAVRHLARKVVDAYGDGMASLSDFDEGDLVTFGEDAGFAEIALDLEVRIEDSPWFDDWDSFLTTSGNPLISSQEEAIREALDEQEAARFLNHLRPLVEAREGIRRSAWAYVRCTK